MLNDQIFKANDIRGITTGADQQWDLAGAAALGQAYAELTEASQIVVGRDMRTSGEALAAAFCDAVTRAGVSVTDIGLASTDELWFASGYLDLPGVQFTASHNPAAYNGMKFCRAQAQPVTPQFLTELAALAQALDSGRPAPARRPGTGHVTEDPQPEAATTPGTVKQRDLLPDYVAYLHSLVDLTAIRGLKVVVDAGNGMAGLTAPAVLAGLNLEVIGYYLELDGTFPNHQPNPLVPENLVDAQQAVLDHGADLALVFDGDADRLFVIDERGQVVSPSAITALIALRELAREPGAAIVINTITSDTVRQLVKAAGGQLVESRVGHTYVKAAMAQHRAVFGGEHSAHYYFRDFWGADTGILAGLHLIAQLGRSDQPLSGLVAPYTRLAASGEINRVVADAPATMAAVAADFADQAELDWGDGVTVRSSGWWFNLRGSNTEPLLRLNVEAADPGSMVVIRDRVLALIADKEAR